jgi:hypothetical protein
LPPPRAGSGQSERPSEWSQPRDEANDAATSWWTWTCCDGTYYGNMMLQHSGTSITGDFYDESADTGGTVSGTLAGTHMEFVRSVEGEQQLYSVELNADQTRGDGKVSGAWVTGNWDFHVVRVD